MKEHEKKAETKKGKALKEKAPEGKASEGKISKRNQGQALASHQNIEQAEKANWHHEDLAMKTAAQYFGEELLPLLGIRGEDHKKPENPAYGRSAHNPVGAGKNAGGSIYFCR